MPEISRSTLATYAVVALVVAALGWRFMHRQQPAPAGGRAPGAGASAAREPSAGAAVRIGRATGDAATVHVAGAVRRPGVYRLTTGARVQDAVRRAGGARPGADANGINLAAKVVDGQQIVVPARTPRGASPGAPAAGAAPGGPGSGAGGAPISLNSATAEQLDTLDGVGPATARKIIDWRTQHGGFRSVADLGQVPGIGPKKLAALRDAVQP